MAMRDDLIRLVGELPESDVPMALRFLRGLRATDPHELPLDDEPWTANDEAAFQDGIADVTAGRVISSDEAKRRLLG